MSEKGRILVADDEQTFLQATGDLLRREGYSCDCVSDAKSGVEKLKNVEYDLLIADIKMPGNPNLEFIRKLPEIAEGMSTILVTGYPSQNSAIDAIQLPVSAYLVKPLNFDHLLEQVKSAVAKSRLYRAVSSTKKRLSSWQEGLVDLEEILKKTNGRFSASERNFFDLTFANITGALSDIRNIIVGSGSDKEDEMPICHLLNCPRLSELDSAVEETIEVLEKTKGSFKSKELAQMRKRLESIVSRQKKLNEV